MVRATCRSTSMTPARRHASSESGDTSKSNLFVRRCTDTDLEFASFNWEDPLNMASLLTEDEQAIQYVPPLPL